MLISKVLSNTDLFPSSTPFPNISLLSSFLHSFHHIIPKYSLLIFLPSVFLFIAFCHSVSFPSLKAFLNMIYFPFFPLFICSSLPINYSNSDLFPLPSVFLLTFPISRPFLPSQHFQILPSLSKTSSSLLPFQSVLSFLILTYFHLKHLQTLSSSLPCFLLHSQTFPFFLLSFHNIMK